MPQTHGTAARHEETKWLRHVQLQLSRGDYVIDMGREIEEGADRLKAGFGANYARLLALKNQYDPTNLFRRNQNIRPIGGASDQP